MSYWLIDKIHNKLLQHFNDKFDFIDANQTWLEVPGNLHASNVTVFVNDFGDPFLASDESKSNPLWEDVRKQRDKLLQESDWTQLPDSPLSEAQKESWIDYRQDLRNIPQDCPDTDHITWPIKP
jgi:hypothetical protein